MMPPYKDRTKAFTLWLTPELYEQFKLAAKSDGVTHPVKLHQLIEDYVKSKQSQMKKYVEFISQLAAKEE